MTSETNLRIERLTPESAAEFRDLRLVGLKEHPESFGASWIDEQAESLAVFENRLEHNTIFGGYLGGKLVGAVAFRQETSRKSRHKGSLWGMYVSEQARRSGIASRLMDHLLEHASTRVEQVHLTVVSTNEAARRLYERKGFRTYGTEPNALSVDGVYYDEYLMVKMLRPQVAPES